MNDDSPSSHFSCNDFAFMWFLHEPRRHKTSSETIFYFSFAFCVTFFFFFSLSLHSFQFVNLNIPDDVDLNLMGFFRFHFVLFLSVCRMENGGFLLNSIDEIISMKMFIKKICEKRTKWKPTKAQKRNFIWQTVEVFAFGTQTSEKHRKLFQYFFFFCSGRVIYQPTLPVAAHGECFDFAAGFSLCLSPFSRFLFNW